jgi:hypothetical protein
VWAREAPTVEPLGACHVSVARVSVTRGVAARPAMPVRVGAHRDQTDRLQVLKKGNVTKRRAGFVKPER